MADVETKADEVETNTNLTNNDTKIIVVDEKYCTPEIKEFVVKRRATVTIRGVCELLDDDGNILLQSEGSNFRIHKKFTMKDSLGCPILTFHEAVIFLTSSVVIISFSLGILTLFIF